MCVRLCGVGRAWPSVFCGGLGCFFGPVVGLSAFFVESLILAQDERWRRA